METLIRSHILGRLIWVCTVCISHKKDASQIWLKKYLVSHYLLPGFRDTNPTAFLHYCPIHAENELKACIICNGFLMQILNGESKLVTDYTLNYSVTNLPVYQSIQPIYREPISIISFQRSSALKPIAAFQSKRKDKRRLKMIFKHNKTIR